MRRHLVIETATAVCAAEFGRERLSVALLAELIGWAAWMERGARAEAVRIPT